MFNSNFIAHIISFSSNSLHSSLNIVFPDSRNSDTYKQSTIKHVKEFTFIYLKYDFKHHTVYYYLYPLSKILNLLEHKRNIEFHFFRPNGVSLKSFLLYKYNLRFSFISRPFFPLLMVKRKTNEISKFAGNAVNSRQKKD